MVTKDCRWDSWRNCEFNEILAFYGLGYWYTWQVSILGLGPMWQSENEALKRKAARLLDEGEVFAFGLSERQHGADIYSTEMSLNLSAGWDLPCQWGEILHRQWQPCTDGLDIRKTFPNW